VSRPFHTDPTDRLRAGLDDPAFDRDISAEALLAGVEDRRRMLVHRRRQRLTVAAAAAAAALVVGGVAVIGNRAPDVTPAQQPVVAPAPAEPPGTPASPDPVAQDRAAKEAERVARDDALARCKQAPVIDGAPHDLPPTSEWQVTDVLRRTTSGYPETAYAFNDSFACLVEPTLVTLSDNQGISAGNVQVTGLTPSTFVVLNPRRLPVAVDGGPSSTEPVQLFDLRYDNEPVSQHHLVVPGSFDGPIPVWDHDGSFSVQDREPAVRPATWTELEDCVDKVMFDERPDIVVRHPARKDIGAAVAGRNRGGYAGFCFDGGGGGTGADGRLHPDPNSVPYLVTSTRTEAGVVVALIAAPPQVQRVEIRDESGARAACTLDGGLALCTLRTGGGATVIPFDSTNGRFPLPVP
jgi:hypothetical protein